MVYFIQCNNTCVLYLVSCAVVSVAATSFWCTVLNTTYLYMYIHAVCNTYYFILIYDIIITENSLVS